MRLISAETLLISKFQSNSHIPSYAILSHCWGKDELCFGEPLDLDAATKKSGFSKLQSACRAALDLEIRWLWMDSVCIDRSSSAELSEAINSMFQWYQNSDVCFVYLDDLDPASHTLGQTEGRLQYCKWMRRSWTVQELIGPRYARFYDRSWNFIGTKASLATRLAEITKIDRAALSNERDLEAFSIATRMSWASRCLATRDEDIAYSLLGIFGVNMPILYGEGHRAFLRLQEEILKDTNDASLFAWRAKDRQQYRGIFATSPTEYDHFITQPTTPPLRIQGDVIITCGGITISSSFMKHNAKADMVLILSSEAPPTDKQGIIGIPLRSWKGRFVRAYPWLTLANDGRLQSSSILTRICMQRDVSSSTSKAIQQHYLLENHGEPEESKLYSSLGSLTPPLSNRSTFALEQTSNTIELDMSRNKPPSLSTTSETTNITKNEREMENISQAASFEAANDPVRILQPKNASIPSISCGGSETESIYVSTNQEIDALSNDRTVLLDGLLTDACDPVNAAEEEEQEEDDMHLFTEPPVEVPHLSPNHPFTQVKDDISQAALRRLTSHGAEAKRSLTSGKRTISDMTRSGSKRLRSTYEPTNQAHSRPDLEQEEPGLINYDRRDIKQRFACPYYKRNPLEHQSCLKQSDLRQIVDVKQHLWFAHRLPNFCPICRQTFETLAACRSHITRRSCDKNSEPNFVGITSSQMQQLARRSQPSASATEQWLEIWNIVFPGEPGPANVFLSGRVDSWVCKVRDYWAITGQNMIAQFLSERGMQNYAQIPNEERELAGLYTAVLEQMIDQIVAGDWPVEDTTTNGRDVGPETSTTAATPVPYRYKDFGTRQGDIVPALKCSTESADQFQDEKV